MRGEHNRWSPGLHGNGDEIEDGEFAIVAGSMEEVRYRRGWASLWSRPITIDELGVICRGVYVNRRAPNPYPRWPILSFRLEDEMQATREMPVVIAQQGIGYGEHMEYEGLVGWHLVGPQIGTLDPSTGAVVLRQTKEVYPKLYPKVYPLERIIPEQL